MSRVVHATAQDYTLSAATARDYLANSLQILQAVIAELRETEEAPFLLGYEDDLMGVALRLRRALDLLDAK